MMKPLFLIIDFLAHRFELPTPDPSQEGNIEVIPLLGGAWSV